MTIDLAIRTSITQSPPVNAAATNSPVMRDISDLILALSLAGSSFVGFKDFLAKAAVLTPSQRKNSAAADSHRKWEVLDGVWKRPGIYSNRQV